MLKNLNVNCNCTGYRIKKAEVHKLVYQLRDELEFSLEYFEINFIDSGTIHQLGQKYLNHDYSTDIITFNYSGDNDSFDGEIFISLEDATENAEKYGVNLSTEVLRLIIHGILHMKGYEDNTSDNRIVMKELEDKLVCKFEHQWNNFIYDRENR